MPLALKKILKLARGYRGRAKNCNRIARNRVEKGLLRAYIGRKHKKRRFRQLWITRIQAASRFYAVPYSQLIAGLKRCSIGLNRKMLAELASQEPYSFESVLKQTQQMVANSIPQFVRHFNDKSVGHIQSTIVSQSTEPVTNTWKRAFESAKTKYYLNYYRQSLFDPLTRPAEMHPQSGALQHFNWQPGKSTVKQLQSMTVESVNRQREEKTKRMLEQQQESMRQLRSVKKITKISQLIQ